MLIYMATNIVNGKKYIGQTTYSLEYRKAQHIQESKRDEGFEFHAAIRKYGVDSFIWEILEDNILDRDTLNRKESYWIGIHDSYNSGYNMTQGGENNPMFAEKSKIRHLNKVRSEEWRKNHSQIMKEVVARNGFSEEHRKKISEKLKGNKHFAGHKLSAAHQEALMRSHYKTVVATLEDGTTYVFNSVREATEWWAHNGAPAWKDYYCSAAGNIKLSSKTGKIIYGVRWLYQ